MLALYRNGVKAPADRLEIIFRNKKGISNEVKCAFESFDSLSKKAKQWLLLNKAKCNNCQMPLSEEFPYCACKKGSSLHFSFRKWKSFERLKESKRAFRRYKSMLYKKKKNSVEGCYTGRDIEEIFCLQKGLCYYCGQNLASGIKKTFSVDHINPLCNEGTNWPKNLALACKKCNSKKAGMSVRSFWDKIKKEHGQEIADERQRAAKRVAFAKNRRTRKKRS